MALAILVGGLTGGCGAVRKTRSMFGGKLPINVVVQPEVNQNSPIAVELLVVYDRPMLDKLLADYDAERWFAEREQLLRDFPDALDSWYWEWVPGQPVGRLELNYKVGAKGGVLFADYFSPGQHRATVDIHKPLQLILEPEGFSLTVVRERLRRKAKSS